AILFRNISAIVIISFFALFFHGSFVQEVTAFPLEKVLLLLAFTFFSRYLNLTFFYESLDRISATTLALIQVATPVIGIFFAAVILGERIQSYQVLGCTFILFGLMLEQVSDRAVDSIRSHSMLLHFSFRKGALKTADADITLLSKHF
ncbi:EamA family transporter, partial [Candidatus Peribacteria bacterium]|nr:EamA family transporter [Candidatus Peribacteria bacterium]